MRELALLATPSRAAGLALVAASLSLFAYRFATSIWLPSGLQPHRTEAFKHAVGNKVLTILSNMLTNLDRSDVWAEYKVFRRSVLDALRLQEDRFGFEAEIPRGSLKEAGGYPPREGTCGVAD